MKSVSCFQVGMLIKHIQTDRQEKKYLSIKSSGLIAIHFGKFHFGQDHLGKFHFAEDHFGEFHFGQIYFGNYRI